MLRTPNNSTLTNIKFSFDLLNIRFDVGNWYSYRNPGTGYNSSNLGNYFIWNG
ncbi:hypothetical protein [Spiroplasma taiwanense]|uniref:hypothetical protein n=1 Tax=Spiroplasma taiwanense TaxID=2145 RepID=UPI00040B3036|nr:hypothetical protein [Spiroplasma taiwanense]